MTALAEINKSILAIGPLQGSDLTDFNEAHPRDEAGRFAAQRGGGTTETDPRVARTKRRLRRARSAAGARAVSAQAKAKAIAEDVRATGTSSLASLRRERIRPELKRPEQGKKQAAPQSGKAKQSGKATEEKPEIVLNDPKYLEGELGHRVHDRTSHVVLTPDEARDFFKHGSLAVEAANKKWKTQLEGYPRGEVGYVAGMMADEIGQDSDDAPVILRIRHSHYADEESIGGGLTLSGAQMLEPVIGKPGERGFTDIMHFDRHGDVVESPFREMRDAAGHPTGMHGPAKEIAHSINVIDVEVHTQDDWQTFMRHKPNVAKADWVEHEHARDIESGRFTRMSSRDTPPGQFSDPRIARSRRRQRRGLSAAQVRAARPAPVVHATAERPALERREYQRQELRRGERAQHRADPRMKARPESAVEETFEPPKRKPNRFIPASGEGSYGGRIVTEEEFQRYEAAKKKAEPISNRTPSRSLSSIKRSASVVDEPEIKVKRLVETEHLGREPRYTEDEFGRPNKAWLEYHAARRARKAAPKTP